MSNLFPVDFLEPLDIYQLSNDEGYTNGQIGKSIAIYQDYFPDLTDADIVIVGCNESRGDGLINVGTGVDEIRKELYKLFHWHTNITLADIGNIKTGAQINDSYAALKEVVYALLLQNKTVLILGGGHDLTMAQYHAHSKKGKLLEATIIDALIDIDEEVEIFSKQFLMQMLTAEPNYIKHYNHIGFQSYFINPSMLETIDKLRFDCYRLGKAKELIEEMEPVLRNSNLVSFDLNALQHAAAPATALSPNGFSGEEACNLMQFAGLSSNATSVGLYGYQSLRDANKITAQQASQMIWYFIDGKSKSKYEAAITDKENFNEFHTAFAEVETHFLQSKKTGRWWMQLPTKNYIACSYNDYIIASKNEIPERWLRAQERL
jgi:formiminoglutamase